MKLIKEILICLFIILSLATKYKCDSVCDLNTLIVELNQDLADNGMLDCLRVIDPPHFVDETEDQKNLRLAAQWDTACAFEADTDWKDMIAKEYGINQLVDSVGDPVSKDFDNQADMCEIIRAAVSKNIFDIKDLNMQNIPKSIINRIDCAGTPDKKGPRICAATGTSYFQKDSWTIFLIPSYMRFAGKPRFIREKEINSSEATVKQPTDNLLKSLLKMGRNTLVNNEDKIARMINNEASDDQEQEHQKEKSRIVHVHVKRSQTSTIKNSGEFAPLEGGDLSFRLDESRLIFSFYMLSFKLKQLANFSSKLSFNGREIAESRQSLGMIVDGSSTSAFAEVYQPKGDNVEINILYESTAEGDINTTAYDHNLSYGAISMPVGSVFKHINSKTLNIRKSDTWLNLMGFDLNFNFEGKGDTYFMLIYNFSMNLGSKAIFQARFNIDGKVIKESTTSTGPAEYVGNHGTAIMKMTPGNHVAKIDYKFDANDDLNISTFTDPHFIQSMVAFQLPAGTTVTTYTLEKSINLNTKGSFKSFGLSASLSLETEKTVLIIYNVNLRVEGQLLSLRLRQGNTFNKKSVISSKDLTFGKGQGYVVRVLKKGNYSFDIDFKSDSNTSFEPTTSDSQVVSMQIIEMD